MEAFRHQATQLGNALIVDPANSALSSLVLVGSYAFQRLIGPGKPAVRSTVDNFLARETPIALQHVLCSIGPDGCYSSGVSAGAVIASPQKSDPDYFYTWTRDSALVLKGLIEDFSEEYNRTLQKHIQDYILTQALLQGSPNPSGGLENGAGLGEPKFNVDLSVWAGNWGRPQSDGPALRATALAEYAAWLLQNGYSKTAQDIVWPIMRNDLIYVAQYWNESSYDLWEETKGSSFFTVAAQYRALAEGSQLSRRLGTSCSVCDGVSPQILCALQNFWSPDRGFIVANFDDIDRCDKDANTILASIHHFDPSAGCDSTTFQPCSDKALANHKVVVDAFRYYEINAGVPPGEAIAVGRYPEDIYLSGNPWYLITLAAAEQMYDSLYVWKDQRFIEVTQISLAFFQDIWAAVKPGLYHSDSPGYKTLLDSASGYADGFVQIVARYAHENGSMPEQFDKVDGTPLSAYDLTWSYAAILSVAARRKGVVPRGWSEPKEIPQKCSAYTMTGSYATVKPTTFPASQTPKPA